MWPSRNSLKSKRRASPRLGSLILAATGVLAHPSFSAEIAGEVTSASGAPLQKVPLCLRDSENATECLKVRFSDRSGAYSFKGVKAGRAYTIAIFLDRSAASRKFDNYKTYVWTSEQSVFVEGKNQAVTLPPFVGKFNYSNFQRTVELSAADFPEIGQVDTASQPVFLKVSYAPVGSPELPPETVFLGQVTDPANLRLEAMVPLAVTAIDYQLFSAANSYTGRISLAD